jgi:hypothetical protein
MSKNNNICDCELCLFKTFPLDNPLVNDQHKIVEAIIYHFIFRLGNLVKSKKDLILHISKFIAMIHQSYLPYEPIKETINVFYKKIIDSGKGCHFSTNTTLTKHINKEAAYLKLIISSMTEEKEEEVISPVSIVIDDVKEVIDDIKTLQTDIENVIDDIKTIKADIVEDVKEIVHASGSYYSYCVIS